MQAGLQRRDLLLQVLGLARRLARGRRPPTTPAAAQPTTNAPTNRKRP